MVTLKDIAAASEVSIPTVSKILSRSPEIGRINQRTIARVVRIAKELGYQPNLNARALVSRKSMTIGVYIAPIPGYYINEYFVAPFLEGIYTEASSNNYDVMLINFGSSDAGLQLCIEKYRTSRIDGLIVIHADSNDPALQSLLEVGMPIVATDYFSGFDDVATVNLDNVAAINDVFNYLYSLGHSKIAFVGELSAIHHRDHLIRRDTFLKCAHSKGLSSQVSVSEFENTGIEVIRDKSNFCFKDGYYGTEWLLQNKEFTALVCYNDIVAIGAMKRLAEAGIAIPNEVSVTGFDDTNICVYTSPSLTSVSHPNIEMGKQAVQYILDCVRKDKGDSCVNKIVFKPQLVVRESTGKAPGDEIQPEKENICISEMR